MKLGSKETVFKLDTGADITAITHEFYKRLGYTTLQVSFKTLLGPGHHKLKVMGELKGILSYKGRCTLQRIIVIEGGKKSAVETNLRGLAQEDKGKIYTNF